MARNNTNKDPEKETKPTDGAAAPASPAAAVDVAETKPEEQTADKDPDDDTKTTNQGAENNKEETKPIVLSKRLVQPEKYMSSPQAAAYLEKLRRGE